jgi:hypothetical protein
MRLAGVGIGVLSGLSAAGWGLSEARIQANEASVIGSLRAIVSAQAACSSSCGAGASAHESPSPIELSSDSKPLPPAKLFR